MAVDLTPRFRRIKSQYRTLGESATTGFTGPFQATRLWKNIIHVLQAQVDIKRRRWHLRTYNACFTGSDAVDVVLSFLMQNIYFSCTDISRLKAVRLCQLLMDSKVFEPVGGKLFRKEKDMVFEDAHCSLYRFLDCDALPGSFKRVNTENMSPDYLHVKKKKKKKNSLEKITFSNPLALESSDRRIEKLLQMINLRPLVPANSTSESSTSLLSKQVVEGIWRQQTLLYLLQLIELPILDGILASSVTLEQRNTTFCNQDGLIISNTFVDRVVSQSLQLSETDMWLSAAIDCLDLFPDQMLVTIEHLLYKQHANENENVEAKKRLLFDTIAKYYNRDCDPLMTSRYFNIHSGIVDLLEKGKIQQALEASQLCFRLLEPNVRDELRRLLAFMNFAADPDAYKLHKQHENSTVVCRTFARAVNRNASLSKTQTDLLLKFLMNNQLDLFKTPVSLIDTVRKKLHSLHHGMDLDELGAVTFCKQFTTEKYEELKEETTNNELLHLIQNINQSTTIPVKEKKRLLKDFQKHHTEIYLQHFSSGF
ncbi:DEP domain-containing protein 4 [Erpetoichthys calabaricus]|uniref:DEP domain-containing protein 4 n=1 Tax=Erpetoichthys calabaricus TaxID=27687 RepID=UPI002234AFFD|nr:DEP domain-containing protein 4 [Erpetoichthys calabaricus]